MESDAINKTVILILSLSCFFLIVCIIICKLNKLNNLTVNVETILKKHMDYDHNNIEIDNTTKTIQKTQDFKKKTQQQLKFHYFFPYKETIDEEIEEFTLKTLPSYTKRNKQDIDISDNLLYYPQQTSNFYGYPGLFISTQNP